ncbi:MAG: hypothetical protein ACRENW_08520 [Thermodesulfobacteriota bacterium]
MRGGANVAAAQITIGRRHINGLVCSATSLGAFGANVAVFLGDIAAWVEIALFPAALLAFRKRGVGNSAFRAQLD